MLNRSCERCRNKKLRCQGGDPCVPCTEAEHECVRIERKKKVMKARGDRFAGQQPSAVHVDVVGKGVDIYGYSNPETTLSSSSSSGLSAARSCSTGKGPTSSSITPPSGAGPPSLLNPHSPIDLHPVSATTSSLAGSAQRSCPELYPDDLPALLTEARSAIGFSLEACQLLLSVSFRYRVLPIIFGCIHVPSLQKSVQQLFDATDDHTLSDDVRISIDQLILILITLSNTLMFSPPNGNNHDTLRLALHLSSRLPNGDPGARHQAFYALAKKLIMRRISGNEHTFEGVQSIILFILHDLEDQATTDQLSDRALRWALKMGMHRITGHSIEEEMRVRAWWYLVSRSWLAGPVTWMYTIHPAQFSSRLPLNVEDGDLNKGLDRAALMKLKRKWTPASYALSLISLATTVRKLVDLHNEMIPFWTDGETNSGQALSYNAKIGDLHAQRANFHSLIVQAFDELAKEFIWFHAIERPFDFGVAEKHEIPFAHAARIEMERWLLHQQVFHCFLELNEVNSFVEQDVPVSCLQLAHHILDGVDKYARHCSVLSASSLPARTLTTAGTVIAFHVLNHGRHLDAAHASDFVKVAVAAAKARRFSYNRQDTRALQRLDGLVDFWRSSLPSTAVNKATKEIEVREGAHLPECSLEQKIEDAASSVFDQGGFLNALPSQLWKTNESWKPALQWSLDNLTPSDSTTGSATAIDPSLLSKEGPQWHDAFSASMVPGLAAVGPAFQMDIDEAGWESLYKAVIGVS